MKIEFSISNYDGADGADGEPEDIPIIIFETGQITFKEATSYIPQNELSTMGHFLVFLSETIGRSGGSWE